MQEEEVPRLGNKMITIELMLGDVIRITTDEGLIKNEYYIEYINREKIKAIHTETLEKVTFQIDEEYELHHSNGNKIEGSILLIYRQKEKGFARQNLLIVDTWVSISFEIEDEKREVIGQIVELPEDLDMITILSHPEKQTYYLNFAYEGLSEDFHIASIKIISSPYTNEEFFEMIPEIAAAEEGIEQPDELRTPPILELGKMIPLGRLEDIVYYVNADESQFRYDLETQKNDLLNNMLSKLPKSQRTQEELSNISLIIERFRQLRQEFSVFDQYGNIINYVNKGAKWKPLVHNLLTFSRPLYWIVPVGTQTKMLNLQLNQEEGEEEEGAAPLLSMIEDHQNVEVDTKPPNEEISMIIQEFKNGPNVENRYVKMLQQLYRYFQPFRYNVDRFNILTSIPILSPNMKILIHNGNKNDFGSNVVKVVIKGSKDSTYDVFNQKYVTGVYLNEDKVIHASKFTSDIRMTYTRERVNNTMDHIDLVSILTLPDQVIQFSRVNLPGTNIMTKAKLGQFFVNFTEIFNREVNANNIINTIHLNNLDNPDNYLKLKNLYDTYSFIGKKKMVNYTTNTIMNTENQRDMYEKYLDLMIPQSKLLFDLVKKHINGRMSIIDVIHYLEPFLIYQTDVTFKFYEEIKRFVDFKIREYKKQLKEKNYLFHGLKTHIQKLNKSSYQTEICCKLIKIIGEEDTGEIYNMYGLSNLKISRDAEKVSDIYPTSSELLHLLTKVDYHRVLSYQLINKNLLVHPNTDRMIQLQEERAEQWNTKGDCNQKYVIAKVYNNEIDLKKDNDVSPIYYDRELNSGEMGREVEEGDIAALYKKEEDSFQYYRRKGEKWMIDNSIVSSVFSGEFLCGLKENCIRSAREDTCISMDMAKMNITDKNIDNVMNEFDHTMDESEKELMREIDGIYAYYKNILPKLIRIEKNKQYGKYEYVKYELGERMKKEIQREDEIVQSPYIHLRDIILGESSFEKRQRDIITFKEQMTLSVSTSTEVDSLYWFYCNKTNAKLLPKFIYELAYTYINDNDNYTDLIDTICQRQGKISDDGDKWVDKYSGYVIKNIDYDVEEGYEGGFKVSTRAKLDTETTIEDEVNDDMKTQSNENPIYMKSVYYKTIIRIIDILSKLLQVSISSSTQNDFIANLVYHLMNRINTKEQFIQANKDKEKTYGAEEYAKYVNTHLLFYSLGVYSIALQTNVPSIRINGNIYTLDEYPLQLDGNKETFYYIVRTLLKEKSLEDTPWNILFHKSKDKDKVKPMKFEKVLEIFSRIEGQIVKNEMVEYRQNMKMSYLESPSRHEEKDEYNITKWTQFLPPLFDIRLKLPIENISSEFKSSILQKIKVGDSKQIEEINVLRGKLILFSVAIVVSIQEVVSSESLILESNSGKYYLENACCKSDKIGETVIEYFSDKNRFISKYIVDATEIGNILFDIRILTMSPFLFSREDHKNHYPQLDKEFSEETIYMSFILYCNFQSLKPMNDRLKQICHCKQKPTTFNINDTIQQKIEKIKSSGKKYTNEDLLSLLKYIGENHIVYLNFQNGPVLNPYEMMKTVIDKNVLEHYSRLELENRIEDLTPSLLPKVNDWLSKQNIADVYERIEDSERNELLEEVIRENMRLKNLVFGRISTKKKMSTKKNDIQTNFEYLFSTENQSFYNMISFIQYYIYFIARICPKMMIDYKFDKVSSNLFSNIVPSYQGLSTNDSDKIKKMTETYYESLIKFYEKNQDSIFTNQQNEQCGSWFCQMLLRVMELTEPLITMMHYTPILSNKNDSMPILDKEIAVSLLEYYLLVILNTYRELYDELNVESDTIYNELMNTFVHVMLEHKITVSYKYQTVVDIEFKSREIEKYLMTDRLKDMLASERKVDNLMKKHKLGLWGVGLKKQLFQYTTQVGEQEGAFIKELEKMESHLRKEYKLQSGPKSNITQNILLEALEESMIEDIKSRIATSNDEIKRMNALQLLNEDGDGDGDLDEDDIIDDYEYDSDDDDHFGYNRDG